MLHTLLYSQRRFNISEEQDFITLVCIFIYFCFFFFIIIDLVLNQMYLLLNLHRYYF